ncbi:MAG: type II secretion system protein [Isosphaeraceae bacterium]|nr:type II secretion system protein [Isosphaeraceae bacterium]
MTHQRLRRGYSLIEMLIVISGIAILFGMSVGMIHMLLRLDRGNRARIGEKTTISRLAHALRRDAHAAVAARRVEAEGHEGVAFDLGKGHKVDYVDEGGRLVRHETAPGETPRREAYRLPSRGRPKLELREEAGQRWAILTLDRNPNAQEIAPARPVVVEAWIGKDAGLARAGEGRR